MLRGLLARQEPGLVDAGDDPADRAERIRDYLVTHRVPKLQLGAGQHGIPGWLATDINPRHDEVVEVDVREPLPFPDRTFDYVHAEHLIEHVAYRPGQRLLRECHRVLRPGGVLRVATPDLARLVAIYRGDAGPEGDVYLDYAYRRWLRGRPLRHPVFLLNHNVRAWGHQFLYDEDLLSRCLADAGYVDITPCALGESAHEELRGVERHGGASELSRRAVAYETMVLEATKPSKRNAES
jgi:predicted SAM-dependent methyltransferase